MKPPQSRTAAYIEDVQAKIEQEEVQIENLSDKKEEHRKDILGFLKKVPASFVAEIAWETGITEYHVKPVLRELLDEEMVETIQVDPFVPDRRLAARVPDMSARGQAGFENFSRRRWFGITDEGRKFL